MSQMFEEIKALRSTINTLNNNPTSTVVSAPNVASPPPSQLPTTPASIQLTSPILPVSQSMPDQSPNNPLSALSPSHHYRDRSDSVQTQPYHEHIFQLSLVPSTCDLLTPGTSPRVIESPQQALPISPKPEKRKKKRSSSPSSDDDDGSSSSSSSSIARRPRKRRNNHDTRCYTIHVRSLVLFVFIH